MTFDDKLRELVREVLREELSKQTGDALITVADYAHRHAISERTVRDAIRDGRLAHERIGRAVRVPANAKIEPRIDEFTRRARAALIGGRR